ncbi:MAG: transposase [Methanobrevibacter sp.]|nr:transposase [Methanobrevibacter sp.]
MFMLAVESEYYSIQAPLIHKSPVEDLNDSNMAKLVVHLVKLFEKENTELFKGKAPGVPGPKFRYSKSEMLGLYAFATFRGYRSCRKIEEFLDDKSKACMYITNQKLPRKSKINQFKNDYEYLIKYFFKFTVQFGFKMGLVDFKIISIDSTPIEAYVNEFRSLSIAQIIYLEDLIYDYSFDKATRIIWSKIKRFFFMDELPEDMIDLIDEIHHNLNEHSRQLLQIALTSKKARNEILDTLEVLKENYDGNNRVSVTDPEARKMHMKDDTIKFAYLLQTVVDVKTGLILMQRIVEDKTDRHQLKPTIDYIIETYNVVPEYILADNGYYGLDQIEYAYSQGIIPIISDRNDAMKSNGTCSDNPHAKCNMHFDPIKIEFTCLNNQKLKVDGIVEKDGELKLRFRTLECPNCPYKKECAKNNKYRVLYESFNPFFIERKKAFLSQKGQQIYKLRAIHSEGAFSEIKEIQEFKQSKRRGRTKVEIDLILEAIVFNLRKIRNHLNVTLI